MKKQILHIITWKEKNLFVAKFLEIELASQGKTQKEAVKNLKEAFELYTEDDKIQYLSFPSLKDVTTLTFSVN